MFTATRQNRLVVHSLIRDQEVASSNLVTPTDASRGNGRNSHSGRFCLFARFQGIPNGIPRVRRAGRDIITKQTASPVLKREEIPRYDGFAPDHVGFATASAGSFDNRSFEQRGFSDDGFFGADDDDFGH